MRRFPLFLLVLVGVVFPVRGWAQYGAPEQDGGAADLRTDAEQLFALASQSRAQAGVGRLQWDPALAQAALAHCQRMAQEGPIAHRYGGEPDVAGRAAAAGAHFSVIEENVAIGPSAPAIHAEWMNSPGHRANLLNAQVDRVGIAVVAARGVLYATEDFSHAVPALSREQVEAQVAGLIRVSGVGVLENPSFARAACASDDGLPRTAAGAQPRFVMRWQDSDLTRLPPQLVSRLRSRNYRWAAVGNCAPQNVPGTFTAYRLAVLLY